MSLFKRTVAKIFAKPTLEQKAHQFLLANQWEEAVKTYCLAIQHNPKSFYSYLNCAHALLHLQRWEESSEYYNKAIECNDTVAEAHQNLGVVLLELNKYKLASESFKKALNLDNTLTYSLDGLINSYVQFEDSEKAIALIRTSVVDNPNPGSYKKLGDLLRKSEQYDEAFNAYERALELGYELNEIINLQASCQLYLSEELKKGSNIHFMSNLKSSLNLTTLHGFTFNTRKLFFSGELELAKDLVDFAINKPFPQLSDLSGQELLDFIELIEFSIYFCFLFDLESEKSTKIHGLLRLKVEKNYKTRFMGYEKEMNQDDLSAMKLYLASIVINPYDLIPYISLSRVLIKLNKEEQAQLVSEQLITLGLINKEAEYGWHLLVKDFK